MFLHPGENKYGCLNLLNVIHCCEQNKHRRSSAQSAHLALGSFLACQPCWLTEAWGCARSQGDVQHVLRRKCSVIFFSHKDVWQIFYFCFLSVSVCLSFFFNLLMLPHFSLLHRPLNFVVHDRLTSILVEIAMQFNIIPVNIIKVAVS